MKQIIRLTESDLHRVVKESVKKIIREYNAPEYKILNKLDMGIRSAGAEMQYGNEEKASMMVEDIIEYARMYESQLSIINVQELINKLTAIVHPTPVDRKQFINVLKMAGKIVKQGLNYQREPLEF